uniref:Galaxin n=2 Tax=Panagrolaimus sp. PS1159 TaxID=55785 RepID=A0AC35GDS3_9BILA
MVNNFIVIYFLTVLSTVIFGQKLILRACCNGIEKCREYNQPEEMFGVACCGKEPMNQFESICCENVIRSRKQGNTFIDKCCGNQTLAYDQTCCQGIVHNIPNGECCGSVAFSRTNTKALCCDGSLNLNADPGSACCGTIPFDGGIRESCCAGQVYLKDIYDGCCPIPDSIPLSYNPYNSKRQICCDLPIQKIGNTKCCYLRNSNGTFIPKSFDYSTSCCAYPYIEITQKTNNACITPQ